MAHTGPRQCPGRTPREHPRHGERLAVSRLVQARRATPRGADGSAIHQDHDDA